MFLNLLGTIDTTAITTAITDGKTAAEALVIAGLAIYGVFVTVKIIKKGISRVG